MAMIWPIALVVFSNMNTMASMTIIYLVGALCSAIMFFVMTRGGSLIHEYSKMNIYPALLGISVVGLEVGVIYAYKAGWAVNTASIVQSVFVAIALIFVGAIIYNEGINANKIIGIVICLAGLYFINK